MEKKVFLERLSLLKDLIESGDFSDAVSHPFVTAWLQDTRSAGSASFIRSVIEGLIENISAANLPDCLSDNFEWSLYVPYRASGIPQDVMRAWADEQVNRQYMYQAVDCGAVVPRLRNVHHEGELWTAPSVEDALCAGGMWYHATCIAELVVEILLDEEVTCQN